MYQVVAANSSFFRGWSCSTPNFWAITFVHIGDGHRLTVARHPASKQERHDLDWLQTAALLCFLFSVNVCFRQFIHRIITNWLHVIANLTPFRLAVNWGQFPTWMASFNCKLITDWHRLIAFLSASRWTNLMTTTDFDDCQRCSVPLTISKGMTLHH